MKSRFPSNLLFTLILAVGALSALALTSKASVTGSSQDSVSPQSALPGATRSGSPSPHKPILTAPYVSEPVPPADTRGLPPAPRVDPFKDRMELREVPNHLPLPRHERTANAPRSYDPVVQQAPGRVNMPPTIQNFEGIGNVDGILPPDTDGQVGPNHYIQMVNVSTAIYDKESNLLYGPFHPTDLWPPADPCRVNNDGDVVVLYDQLADRWLLTQFALPDPYYQCIAVSKTGIPTNDPDDWYPYTFLVHNTKMNDYPKLGIWPDGYYMSANQFTGGSAWGGAGVWVFDRDAMLNGDPATFQYFDVADLNINYGGLLPSNLMGDRLPPSGAPNYFLSVDQNWSGADDVLHIFEFHTDWDTPANSTFGLAADLVVAPFDWDLCANDREQCIHQPGGAPRLEAISDRLMMHLWYRNLGSHESLVVNHTVDANGAGQAGIRWYEIRGGAVDTTLADGAIYQQGTYAPDSSHRWMGSIAMDHVGNIALGYSVSSSSVYPSIRYAGRKVNDPLGTLPEAEVEIIAGSGSQTHSSGRWGDYSAMSVDPADDCTFWYTQEYIETTGPASWQTRIASFEFPNCSLGPQGTLDGIVYEDGGTPTSDPIANARVQASSSSTQTRRTTSGTDGHYTMALLTGTYTVTASAYGYQPTSISSVGIFSGTTTTQDITLTPALAYVVEGTVTDATTGWPLYAHIAIQGDPVNPPAPYNEVWNDPVTGHYSITLAEGITYTFNVEAWVEGYLPTSRNVGPLTANATEDFALTADPLACAAPGYKAATPLLAQGFESATFPPNGWSRFNLDGGGEAWQRATDRVRSGSGSAQHDWSLSPENGWLVAPAFMPSTGSLLRFWENVDWSGDYGKHSLWVCTASCGSPPTNYTEIAEFDNPPEDAWRQQLVGLNAYAAQSIRLAFRYEGTFAATWWIDDVSVPGACNPQSGGLVVGNVYDGNTGNPLIGASVENEDGYTATTGTTVDPGVDDGFYTLFSPAGSKTYTATMPKYGPAAATVSVVPSDTLRQDFNLPAGWLAYSPASYDVTLRPGMSTTLPFTLANSGGLEVNFEFQEVEGQFGLLSPGTLVTTPPSRRAVGVAGTAASQNAPWRYPAGGTYYDPTPSSLAVPADVLLVFADDGPDPLKTILESYPDIGLVGAWDARTDIPALGDLLPYDVLVVWSNYEYPDNVALGDVLADYVDAGGKVIVAAFSWADSFLPDTVIAGRFADESYNPLISANLGNHAATANLGTFDGGHPIMQGVTAASDYFRDYVTLDPGAYLVARWTDDEEFIATKGGVVAINAYTGPYYQWTGDVGIIFHNAVNYLLTEGDVPWLSERPITGTLPALVDQTVGITFDASVPEANQPGIYQARLIVRNTTPYLLNSAPVTLTVASARPLWEKKVSVNGIPISGTVYYGLNLTDTIQVVDRVMVTHTTPVTFSLVEAWSASLTLTHVITDGGSLDWGTGMIAWNVAGGVADTWYAITKTFEVLSGTWDVDYITETLTVSNTVPQLDPVVLKFSHAGPTTGYELYLPLVLKNQSPAR